MYYIRYIITGCNDMIVFFNICIIFVLYILIIYSEKIASNRHIPQRMMRYVRSSNTLVK